MEEDKEKNVELDNWQMDDLKEAVKAFKAREEGNDNDDSVSSVESGLEDNIFGKKN
jgi:hypothetical protein